MTIRKPVFVAMKYGEKSDRILKAQKVLAKAGSTIQPNGVYSIGMVTAVKAFQKMEGLKITGVIDAKTFEKLLKYDKPVRRATRKPASSRT